MRSIKTDVVLNLGLSFASIGGTMWMLWLATRTLTAAEFGLFLLMRRLADTGSHFMHLGAPIALRRYLTISRRETDKAAYFSAGLVLSAAGMVACMSMLMFAPRFWGHLLFGFTPEAAEIAILTGLMSCALVTNYLASSTLLARGHIIAANLTELTNVALVPIAAMYVIRNIGAHELIGAQTAVMASLSLTMIITLRRRINVAAGAQGGRLHREHVLENATYGLPRAAGLALETGFLVIGPWLLRDDLTAVGYLGIAFVLLRLARTVIQPVTILVAMRLGSFDSRGAHADVQRGLDFVVAGVLLSLAALLPPVHAWSALILQLWLGGQLGAAVEPYVQLLLIAVVPLSLLQTLKEPIEIMWKTPFVLGLFGVGSLALVAGERLLTPHVGTAVGVSSAYVAAYTLMCAGALLIVRRRLSHFTHFGVIRLTLLGGAAWAANLAIAASTQTLALWARVPIMMFAGTAGALLVAFGYLFVMPSSLAKNLRNYLLTIKRPI